MAKQSYTFWTKEFQNTGVTFVNADGTTKKTIFTGGADDSIIRTISICSDDTSSRIIQLFRTISATDYIIGSILVPTLSGTDGSTPRVNGLNGILLSGLVLDKEGNYVLQVVGAQTITASVTVAVTSAKTITIVTVGENF